MNKLQRVRIGLFEVRQWTEKNREWVIGLNINDAKHINWEKYSGRFDIRYILDMHEWDFCRLVVDEYHGKIYPWFGLTSTMPLAAFPNYWDAKKFVVDYVEPQLLMQKMAGGWG